MTKKQKAGTYCCFAFFVDSEVDGEEYENTSSFSNPTLDFIFTIGYY